MKFSLRRQTTFERARLTHRLVTRAHVRNLCLLLFIAVLKYGVSTRRPSEFGAKALSKVDRILLHIGQSTIRNSRCPGAITLTHVRGKMLKPCVSRSWHTRTMVHYYRHLLHSYEMISHADFIVCESLFNIKRIALWLRLVCTANSVWLTFLNSFDRKEIIIESFLICENLSTLSLKYVTMKGKLRRNFISRRVTVQLNVVLS